MALVTVALLGMPRKAEASCGPCGGSQCIFAGACYGVYSQWCYQNQVFTCTLVFGNPCPVVQGTGQSCGGCAPNC